MKSVTNQKREGISSDRNQLHYGVSLKLYFENKAFGPGMPTLLRGVESTGSLQGAAQTMSMAYGKTRKVLREPEKVQGFILTERGTEGGDNDGSTLAPQAVRLLEVCDAFMAETRQELDRLSGKHFSREWVEDLKRSTGLAKE